MKKIFLIAIATLGFVTTTMSQKVITNYWGYTQKINEQYQVNAQGVKNGYYKAYSKEGLLIYSYNFLNGKENGLCIDYAGQRNGVSNNLGLLKTCYGKPMLERQMKNGELVSEKFYDCLDGKQIIAF